MTESVVRYFSRVGTAFSILLNVLLGGSSNQTLSARNYARKRDGQINFVWLIDAVFFWDAQHCMTSWLYWYLRYDTQLDMNKENSNGKEGR